jgi:predicted helicase
LEEPHDNLGTLFSQQLAKESEQASKVKKEQPIMVVMGNPPYSGISSNNGERITKMIEDYKYIDGVHFGERKHRLQDDYVKFIRFAESFVEKNGEGIVAYINNHGFLDNPTFRGMRWHLLQTFDSIYIVDLHGNSKKKEVAPDGSVDQNVFDIQAGVSIQFFVKTGKSRK